MSHGAHAAAAQTLLRALLASLDAATRSPEGVVEPAAILWTDTDAQWLPLLPTLRAVFPWIYTLGRFDAATRTGPAIWLKCIVDRTLPEAPPLLPPPYEGKIPVLYLPRVSRQELRAAGDCPPALQPLVELQYRGRVWHQPNGHDWTVRAFLVSDDGLGLDVAGDRRTEEAFLRVLPILAETDARALQGRRLDADDFDKLSVQDPVRDLLLWLNNPETFEAAARGGRWESFRGLCQSEFGLDPEGVPAAEVAGMLVRAEVGLDRVWSRFAESPQLYAGVAKLLRDPVGAAQGLLVLDPSRDPRINEQEEAELRQGLQAAAGLAHGQACAKVLELEKRHAERREWVWARTEMSPWAWALQPLARLAQLARKPLGGATLSQAVTEYAQSGWECDRAALDALVHFRNGADAGILRKLVQALYEPWLDASARHFQSLLLQLLSATSMNETPTVAGSDGGGVDEGRDVCLLFVDGLRFDLANLLAARLEARSLQVTLRHRLAPLPTVTPTAKVAASPVAGEVVGGDAGEDFTPFLPSSKSGLKPAIAPLFRERLQNAGLLVLDSSDTSMPSAGGSADLAAGAWTECGLIDSMGHNLQGDLVYQLGAELDRIADRAFGLLDAGWRAVRIVTDHGWILLPEGLPKVSLPAYLTETKWARCAVVKGSSDVGLPTFGWHWNPKVRIVSPPGIACFRAGERYAHGGVSPQECVAPELVVERRAVASYASIVAVQWRGMRCKVQVETNDPGVVVDLRSVWKQESSSIVAAAKSVGPAGEVSLAVADDRHEGAAAWVVVVDASGKILAQQTTSVGEAGGV